MDNLTDNATNYREIVKQVIGKYAQLKPSHGEIRLDPVFDEIRYVLMQVGWDRGLRIRGNLIYITLEAGKIYIEYDGMECGITQDLIDECIPQNDIILAFLSPDQVLVAA